MRSSLANAVESVLFVAEKPVSRAELARVVGATPKHVDNALAELATSYQGTALRLAHDGDDWQLVTAPEHAVHVAAYLGADRLRVSPASLETLAIVAYRQPVTKAAIERIRGVDSDYTIRTLLHRRLVLELGRADTPGRPFLYGTGFEFLERFGLTSLDELPPLEVDLAARLLQDDEIADRDAALGPPVDIDIEAVD